MSSATELLAEGGPSPTLRAAVAATNRKPPAQGREAKKAGGGRGSWGVPGDELSAVAVLDAKDPNYDREQEPFMLDTYQPKLNGAQLKDRVVREVDHFLGSGRDVHETAAALEGVSEPLYRYHVVYKLLQKGLPECQGIVKDFLTYASSPAVEFVSQEQLERGLQDAFEAVADWELDSPGAQQALADVTTALEESDRVTAGFLEQQVAFVSRRAGLKHCFNEVLDEFEAGGDINEVVTHVKNMQCAPFLSFAIKHILRRAAALKAPLKANIARMLCALQQADTVSRLQTMRGVELLLAETEDILLDLPKAVPLLGEIVARCVVDECIPPSLLINLFAVHEEDAGMRVVESAQALLKQPGAAEAVTALWESSE